MTRRDIGYFSAILTLLGAGWGLTVPLTKIAVSTGFGHFGLIFWQLVIGTLLMGALTILRRKRLPITLSTLRVCAVVALIGTLIPNSASYQAAVHVPAGILSILLSMIPMFAFPVALFLKL
ncbi:MAG: EamA family transporter, partial [Roseobacter sp.]